MQNSLVLGVVTDQQYDKLFGGIEETNKDKEVHKSRYFEGSSEGKFETYLIQ